MIYYPKDYELDNYNFTYKKDLTTEGIEPNPGPTVIYRFYLNQAVTTPVIVTSPYFGPQMITIHLIASDTVSTTAYVNVTGNAIDSSSLRASQFTGFKYNFFVDQHIIPSLSFTTQTGAQYFGSVAFSTTVSTNYQFQMNTEQDKDRQGTISDSLIQPTLCHDLGAFCQGDTMSNISQMIERSTFFVSTNTTDSRTIHLMTHAFGVSDKNAAGDVIVSGVDNLSYFAHLFTFARGGMNYRLQTTGNYRILLSSNNDIDQTVNQTFDLIEQSGDGLSLAETVRSANLVQQSINTSVEGFGEFNVPFYSSTYCYSIDPQYKIAVTKATTDFTLPDTQILIFPQSNLAEILCFRNSTSDFEFSYLSGPPLLLPIA